MTLKQWRMQPWISHVSALGLTVVFLLAAASKIPELGKFATGIGRYKVLHESVLNPLAILLPWWELGAAALLLLPNTRRSGALLVAAMISVFLVATIQAIARGLKIPCDCGLPGNGNADWSHVAFLVLKLGLAYVAARPRTQSGRRLADSASSSSSFAPVVNL